MNRLMVVVSFLVSVLFTLGGSMLLSSERRHILGGQQAVGSAEVSQADAQRRRGISACSSMPESFMQP